MSGRVHLGLLSVTAEPRQVRARVPAASNTQTIMSAPPGVKRTVKWRRQKLPSAWANSASVPKQSGRTVSVAERGAGCASAEASWATPSIRAPKRNVSPSPAVCIGPPSMRSQVTPTSSVALMANWTPNGARSSRSTRGFFGGG